MLDSVTTSVKRNAVNDQIFKLHFTLVQRLLLIMVLPTGKRCELRMTTASKYYII